MKKSFVFIKENGILNFFLKLVSLFFEILKNNVDDFSRVKSKEILNSRTISKDDKFSYFLSPDDFNQTILKIKENHSEKLKVIKDADEILKGKVRILNKNFEVEWDNIDWSQDLLSMNIWDRKYFKKIKIIGKEDSDVKYAWELSRLQFLFTVGKAYSLTGQKKYIEFYQKIIASWEEKNEYQYSVNWHTSMEVGIRAINLIIVRQFFEDENKMQDPEKIFFEKNNKLIFYHGKHIYENLENKDSLRGNHYLSNLSALIYIGLFLNDEEAKKWLNFAIKELNSEIHIQINKDGTNYESSTAYHKLVFEIILFTEVILKSNDMEVIDKNTRTLEKMALFLYEISDRNGQIPLIGDNDSGRIVIVNDYYNSLSTHSVIGLLNIYSRFSNKYIKYPRIHSLILKNRDHLWFTEKQVSRFEVEPTQKISFDNSGFYLLRKEKFEVLVRCGENSFKGKGTHSHNDQLHINIRYKGKELIIDNGTSFYTKNIQDRNKDRSTKSHNTLSLYVDGRLIEQNPIDDNKIFELKEFTNSVVEKHTSSYFLGKHFGYQKEYNTIHSREVKIENKNRVEIIDSISELTNVYSLKVNFLLSESLIIETRGKSELILLDEKLETRFKFSIKDLSNDIKVEDTYYSPYYGVTKATKKIIVSSNSRKVISYFEFLDV